MASVDGSKTIIATSDELFDYVCGPCKTGGNIKEAKQYCGDCSEYLCDLCVEYHPKIPSLKNHKIVSADKVTAESVQRLTVYCGCNKNRDVAFFCEDHTDVICGPCKDVKHHNCQTQTIQQRSSGYAKANLESVIAKSKSLKVKFEQLKQECSGNVEELKRSTENCRKEIKAFRKELNDFLDKLEQSMLAELEQSESIEQQRIDRQIITLTSALQMLETDYQMLNDAKNDGRKHVMFFADIQTSKSLHSYERRLTDLEKDSRKLAISFDKNKKIYDVRTDIINLGTLKISEKTDKQKSSIVLLDQQIESHRKVNVRLANDKKDPEVTGCVVMYNDNIVICDNYNYKLKLLDSSLAVTDSCVMPSWPWDISVLDTNNVIVTIPDQKQLQQVQVIPRLKIGRVIQLDKGCWGVEVSGDKIYVSCHPGDGEVRVLDKKGNLERRLGVNKDGSYMFSGPYYITVGGGGNKIFVSDYSNNTIICMKVDGSILYQYKDKGLRGPEALYCDDSDNILVCCYGSHTVKVITAGGKLYNTILSSKDGLQKPYSVTYRQSDNILVIGCHELDHLLVYHLRHKDADYGLSTAV